MMNIRGTDGVLRTPEEHYDTQGAVEQDPYGAHLAIQIQAAEIADLRAQLAAAEADKLAAMERVREAAARHILRTQLGVATGTHKEWINGNNSAVKASAAAIRALDLSTLAEGDR